MEKTTHLEYYTILIKDEGEDNFFIQIFSTKKKPKEWENVKISIFDSWHDDLIYETNFNSNYLWVGLKSKYGIGAITFIPNNFDKKHKDYIILHEYVNKKNFKPVIGVFVHPNTQERINVTKKHLISLKKCNIPIYLCSNMGCPDELLELCDGYVYTGPNELCTVPNDIINKQEYLEYSIKNPITIHPENFKFYGNHSFINGMGTYLWSAAKCLKSSITLFEQKGYTHVMVSEGEFMLNELDKNRPIEILRDMWDKDVVLDFYYTNNSRYLQAYLWFGEIEHITKSFNDISKENKHYPKNNNNSNANAFVLCEKYYQNKLFSHNNSDKIRVRTLNNNVENIENRYWYTNRTEIISYDVESFKLEEFNTDELLSFPLYFPNTDEVFLSIADKNIKSDTLDVNSFNLGVSKANDNNLVIIVRNNTNSELLDFKIIFYNDKNKILFEKAFNMCFPNIWYFFSFKKPIDYTHKYDYIISLSNNDKIIYKGQFN
jgi:hypothetical protein